MSQSELFQQVLTAIAEWTRRDIDGLSAATVINGGSRGGLALDGADADELIGHVSKVLGWTLSSFDYSDYFGPEIGLNPIGLIGAWFSRAKRNVRKSLTIEDLANYFWHSRPK